MSTSLDLISVKEELVRLDRPFLYPVIDIRLDPVLDSVADLGPVMDERDISSFAPSLQCHINGTVCSTDYQDLLFCKRIRLAVVWWTLGKLSPGTFSMLG